MMCTAELTRGPPLSTTQTTDWAADPPPRPAPVLVLLIARPLSMQLLMHCRYRFAPSVLSAGSLYMCFPLYPPRLSCSLTPELKPSFFAPHHDLDRATPLQSAVYPQTPRTVHTTRAAELPSCFPDKRPGHGPPVSPRYSCRHGRPTHPSQRGARQNPGH